MSWTRLGLVFYTAEATWTAETGRRFGPLKLPSCRRVLLPSWTVESARPLTETPTPTRLLLLNRTAESGRLVKESDLLTASVLLEASYVL